MRAGGFVLCAVFLLLSLATATIIFALLASDSFVRRSAFAGQYMRLDAARNVGLDAGEAWIMNSVRMGYAPRAGFHGTARPPEERIIATSAFGTTIERIDFPGDIGVDVSVSDLDYPSDLFGEKGSSIPRFPISPDAEEAGEIGRYYLIRSTASDSHAQSLCAEELFLVSIDRSRALTGAKKIFYRTR